MKAIKILYTLLSSASEDVFQGKSYTEKLAIIAEAIDELENIENRKCSNCKHCDEMKESMGHMLIHCSFFEEYMPIEIGKCDMWEDKDEH